MSDNSYKHGGRECPPSTDKPAPQPKPPGDCGTCEPLPETTPPTLEPPKPCPPPDSCCVCPTKPETSPDCLEKLIAEQTAGIDASGNATNFVKDLETLLKSARDSRNAYTRDRYDDLVAKWVKMDRDIAELIRKLTCAVPCWRCILDCHVCPLLNELHYAEKWLYDDGEIPKDVHNLYDLQYWHQQNKDAKERTFNRIKNILAAWDKPDKKIETILATNRGLHDTANGVIGTEPGKAIYTVFLQLVPMHLAIAPPAASPDTTTRIDVKYTTFCECDTGKPDVCCGVDLGERSLRQRLIGPQPYLIDPSQYFKLICCLVENRYAPAQAAFRKAETDLSGIKSRIASYEKQLKDWPKNFETAAKGAIPSVIDCCDYKQNDEQAQRPSHSY